MGSKLKYDDEEDVIYDQSMNSNTFTQLNEKKEQKFKKYNVI